MEHASTKYVTVDGSGLVTAKAEGTATITVKTYNGKKATVKVKVVDPYKPTKVSLSQSGTAKLEVGKTLQLSATLEPSTAQSELKWKSSNAKVATVDGSGLVTATGKGTATITVTTHNGKKASVKVSVTAAATGALVSNELSTVLDRIGDIDRKGKRLAEIIGGMKYVTDGEYGGYYYINNFLVVEEDACYVILKNPSPYRLFGMYVGMDVSAARTIFRSHGWNYEEEPGERLLSGCWEENEPWGFLDVTYNAQGKVTKVDCAFD